MKILCNLGIHDWAPWSDSKEVCRKVVKTVNRNRDYHSNMGMGCGMQSDREETDTTTTTIVRRMIQYRRCKDCNLEESRLSFDEAGVEIEEFCSTEKK